MNTTTKPTEPAVKEITDFNILIELIKSKHIVVIDFFATWCGPCKMISPVFAKIAAKLGSSANDVVFVKIDVDKVPESDVDCMPTFRIFEDGTLVDQLEGAPPPAQLEGWIKNHITTKG